MHVHPPGPASDSQVEGVSPSGDEKKFSIADFKGKFFVLVFYRGDQESRSFVQAFSDLAELFRGQKIEVVTSPWAIKSEFLKFLFPDGRNLERLPI